MTKSFLDVKPDALHVSAVKQSESGEGWVVRLFNPFDKTLHAAIRLNGGFGGPAVTPSPVERLEAEFGLPSGPRRKWSTVRRVTLEELPESKLAMDKRGWVKFEISKKKIVTIEFLP
jgi:hypothetical protein